METNHVRERLCGQRLLLKNIIFVGIVLMMTEGFVGGVLGCVFGFLLVHDFCIGGIIAFAFAGWCVGLVFGAGLGIFSFLSFAISLSCCFGESF